MSNNKQIKLREMLKNIRINSGFTQSDISKKLKKPQSYVSKYESGEKTLNFVEVFEICKVNNIAFHQFVINFEKEINES